MRLFFITAFLMIMTTAQAFGLSAKIKNIAQIRGVRANLVQGYGVVFGLQGTGDSAKNQVAIRTVSKMMNLLGVKNDGPDLAAGNFATVLVTANLPPFAKIGQSIDVRVAANGDATSLAGGTLFQTQLKAGDGNTYVVAFGPVVVGQAKGAGTSITTVALVPSGGMIEREFSPKIIHDGKIVLTLKEGDFSTNYHAKEAINQKFRGFYARSLDSSSLEISLPLNYQDRLVDFISKLETIEVDVAQKAVITINERTGTVVMGAEVQVAPISIAHGDLTISVGQKQKEGSLVELTGVSVGAVIKSLNQLGVSPKDLVSILQAIHAAGALKGELVFV